MRRGRPAPIERVAPAELMFLALQAPTVPEQFGAVLVLQPRGMFDVRRAVSVLDRRVRTIPRLRQRIMKVPPGYGGPVWVDDADFDIERHVEQITCPSPGDESALLEVAARLVTRPLPLDPPLWTACLVTGLADGRVALVVVVQHALADGIGGLAVLGALVDGATDQSRDHSRRHRRHGVSSPPTRSVHACGSRWRCRRG
jgi:diacylglycerol O-acyltransferase / wax synthase